MTHRKTMSQQKSLGCPSISRKRGPKYTSQERVHHFLPPLGKAAKSLTAAVTTPSEMQMEWKGRDAVYQRRHKTYLAEAAFFARKEMKGFCKGKDDGNRRAAADVRVLQWVAVAE